MGLLNGLITHGIMKKIGLLILCNLLIYTVELKAQHIIYDRIKSEIDQMKVDTALVYSIACVGCSTLDSCKNEASHYLFWKKDAQYYIKRYDFCKSYNIIELDKKNPLSFYLLNTHIIKNESIKPPTYRKIVKSGDKVDTQLISHYWEDSEEYDFSVFLKGRVFKIHFDVNNLTEQFDEDGKKNIYYDSNRKTRLFALLNKIDGLINGIDKNKKWQPEISNIRN